MCDDGYVINTVAEAVAEDLEAVLTTIEGLLIFSDLREDSELGQRVVARLLETA